MSALLRILGLPALFLSKVPGLGSVIRALSTSVGQKLLMATSGLSLVGFLIVHLGGNLQLYAGEEVFNAYAAKLHSLGPLLAIAEIGLFSMFALHIGLAVSTAAMNSTARASSYAVKQTKQGLFVLPSGGASNWMMVTGLLIFVFLVSHILDMKLKKGFGVSYPPAAADAGDATNAFQNVKAVLQHPPHAVLYFVCLIALGIHLSHGIRSALQTFGLNHKNWNFILRWTGFLLAWAIAGGFISVVAWALAVKN